MNIIKSIALSALCASALASCCTPSAPTDAAPAASASDIVIENMLTRRSIRKYKPQPVEREKMDIIARCGINAPNGMNKQSWEVRIIDSPELIKEITDIYVAATPQVANDTTFKNMFRNAPTVAFVANDPSYGMSQIDCGLLGENMMLSAWSMGIGSCCLGSPVRFLNTSAEAQHFVQKLGFSEGYKLLYCIAFGYPDETPAAKPRDESKVKYID